MPTYLADSAYLQDDLDDIDRRLALLEQAKYGGGDSAGNTNTGAIGSTTTSGSGTPSNAYGSGGVSSSMVVGQIIGTQIKDGVITTAKIIASGISGSVIQANTLSANTITTSTLNTSTLITAGTAGAARVEIDGRTATAGIRLYNSSNANTVNLDATTGNVTITGTFKTAASGQRWELTSAAQNIIYAYSGLAGEASPGYIAITDTGSTAFSPFIRLQSTLLTGTNYSSSIDIESSDSADSVTASIALTTSSVNVTDVVSTNQLVTINSTGLNVVTGDIMLNSASLPRGRVASAKISSTFTVTTGVTETMVTGLAATYTFVTGRRYKITAHAQFQNLTATQGTGTMRVRTASGTSVTTAGTQIGADQNAFPAVAVWRIGFNCVIELVCVASGAGTSQINSGQQTVGVSATIPTNNSLVEASTGNLPIILIEDMGT
jgi:hypothetical protein